MAVYEPRREAETDSPSWPQKEQPCQYLDLSFQPQALRDTTCSLCRLPSVWCFVIAALDKAVSFLPVGLL